MTAKEMNNLIQDVFKVFKDRIMITNNIEDKLFVDMAEKHPEHTMKMVMMIYSRCEGDIKTKIYNTLFGNKN